MSLRGVCKRPVGLPGLSGTEVPYEAGDLSLIPGLERSMKKDTVTHTSVLSWETPWTEGAGGLQSMGSKKS